MSIREEYQAKLKTLHRVQGQAKRKGVFIDYNEVKRPTRASISRLDKAIEMLRTKLFIIRVFPEVNEPEYIPITDDDDDDAVDEANTIIKNFRKKVLDMIDDDYGLQFEHSFIASEKRTGGGGDAKKNSADNLVGDGEDPGGALEEAIEKRGEIAVAISINKNSDRLERLAEDLIFALYDRAYAVWGGGRSSYEAAIKTFFKGILMGDNG